MVLRFGNARSLLVRLSLAFGMFAALAILFSMASSVRAQAAACETSEKPQVPGAVEQDEYCLADLTTKGLVEGVHTSRDDWEGLHAVETVNPLETVPGLQIDG